ncbi:MAG TPA: hypothetical protein VFM62_01950 [Arthrobacter sp.]|nr:hypothetical protein [Arthrobacter sp.]
MPDMFLDKFRGLVPKYLNREWSKDDGIRIPELDGELSRHDFDVPLVLREFLHCVGSSELMEVYNFFWDPDELEIDDGFLLFLEDEEETTVWGFRVEDLDVPDPIVWRRNADGRWESEEGTFSEFVFDQFEWVFTEEDEAEK